MAVQSQRSLKFWVCPQNYANANAFFSVAKTILRYPGYPIWGLTSCRLKNYSNKNHHIFRTGRTSAFIWHPWIPLKNFRIGVIGRNAKKSFYPFSLSSPRINVGGQDNFEATGLFTHIFGGTYHVVSSHFFVFCTQLKFVEGKRFLNILQNLPDWKDLIHGLWLKKCWVCFFLDICDYRDDG